MKDFYDGSGHSITIPTLIIEAEQGAILRELLTDEANYGKVVLKTDIEMTTEKRQTISYTLFYGSVLDLDSELIQSLYEYQHALGRSAIFIPRIFTFECTICP